MNTTNTRGQINNRTDTHNPDVEKKVINQAKNFENNMLASSFKNSG